MSNQCNDKTDKLGLCLFNNSALEQIVLWLKPNNYELQSVRVETMVTLADDSMTTHLLRQ